MSAICGFLRFDGAPANRRDLDRQIKVLQHRGPDGARAWCNGSAALGHLLLRVTAEDRLDAQPLHDASSQITVCADLRLDNREELAGILNIEDAVLRTLPDSALLLRAYAQWGEDCAQHLLGDFAFAIWDARAGKLVLGRDHMGQRQIYYHWGETCFAWATEIKALWALGDVPREMQDEHVASILHYESGTKAPIPFKDIFGMAGATIMTVTADQTLTTRRYWEPAADPAHLGRDEAYYVAAYRRVLTEAIACRLRRCLHPAGLYLAGGFDSSAIAGLSGTVLNAQGRKLVTVSSVMPEDYRGPVAHARRWVERCRRDMAHLDVRYVTREHRNSVSGMEERFFKTDLPHHVTRYVDDEMNQVLASAGVRVVMDGHGGDQTLNPRAMAALARFLATGRLGRFWHEWRAWRRHSKERTWVTVKTRILRMLLPMRWTQGWAFVRAGLGFSETRWPISSELRRLQADGDLSFDERFSIPHIRMRQRLIAGLKAAQNRPAKLHAQSANTCGLDFTQPYHDKRVVELALAIPEDLYFKNGRNRYLARTALKDVYPPEFQDRLPANDSRCPDFLETAKTIAPQVLAEIDRMENAGKLSRYFDFPRMRRMLTAHQFERRRGAELNAALAMRAFLVARHIEWFRGDNR